MRAPSFILFCLGLGAPLWLAGCGGGSGGPSVSPTATPFPGATATPTPKPSPTPTPTATPLPGATATLALQTVGDPWPRASPRWRDIGNNPYSATFRAAFSYSSASVALTYQKAPASGVFVGHIEARGLKPNFAYQLKLAGKPIAGNRGWGQGQSFVTASSAFPDAVPTLHTVGNTPVGGDDWANTQLGYAGRWWDDTAAPSTNLNDAYFRANSPAHTIYGYLFMGDFLTDADGNASADLRGDRSLHITWQDAQSGINDVLLGTFPIRVSAATPAYDAPLSASSQKLWYELEAGRTQPVRLPSGTYHCRLLVTEEAFHTAGGSDGGVWQTVFATEDAGDTSGANDVVFAVR